MFAPRNAILPSANTTGVSYEATENGMKMTITGSNDPHMLLSTTNKDVSGKKYYYFHVDKAAAEGNNCLWMLMYAVGNWAGPNSGWQAKFDGRDYWQDVSVDGSHMLLWDNWNGGIWFKHEIYGGSSINQLQFNFRNDHQPTFTIGNIYAANADDEVPGLLPKQSGYTATFVNGDKAVAAAQGETVTAPDAVAIDGFEFVGWADADDYSKVYKAGSTITLTEDTTFVAAGVSLETLNSASIRWSADDAKRGLRFTGVVRSNLGGAKETGELVSPALVKTAIKDLGNDTVKDVLNSSPKGGNSRWAEESTVTDLCWHGSVTEFAGKGDEVLEHKFSAWAVAEIKYQDGSSGWFVSEATDGFSMKDVAVALKEANTDTSAANYDYINRILKEVYNVG